MSDVATATPVAVGRIEELTSDAMVLGLPGTDYRVHLVLKPGTAMSAGVRDRISGRIDAVARRVDKVPSGGRFIDPIFGRPRRLQGRIIGADAGAGTITVDCTLPFVCRLTDARQKASDFEVGQLVSFDIERGATFTPINA